MTEESTDNSTGEIESLEKLVSPKLNEILLQAVQEGYDYYISRISRLKRKDYDGMGRINCSAILVESLGVTVKKFYELQQENSEQINFEFMGTKKNMN